jgi:hypothetical protein
VAGPGAICDDDWFLPPGTCPAAFVDFARTDYVFAGLAYLDVLDRSKLDYRYGATLLYAEQYAEYTPPPKYTGTLALYVPEEAEGTFTVACEGFYSALHDAYSRAIRPLAVVPAQITVRPPVCGNGACELGEDQTSCPADCAEQVVLVPTLSEWGMLVTTLLILTAGKVFFRRRILH